MPLRLFLLCFCSREDEDADSQMLKAKETALSRNWVVTKRQGASYTGGNVSVTSDGRSLACSCADRVAILDLASGAVTRIIPEDVAVSSTHDSAEPRS